MYNRIYINFLHFLEKGKMLGILLMITIRSCASSVCHLQNKELIIINVRAHKLSSSYITLYLKEMRNKNMRGIIYSLSLFLPYVTTSLQKGIPHTYMKSKIQYILC